MLGVTDGLKDGTLDGTLLDDGTLDAKTLGTTEGVALGNVV